MANKTVCDLWNEFEEKRDATLKEAAIRERDIEIENIEYEILLFGLALGQLNVENIKDIKKIDDKFIIFFKDDSCLRQLLGLEINDSIKLYDVGRGFQISVADNNPEMLDESFMIIFKHVEAIIRGLRINIATIRLKSQQIS